MKRPDVSNITPDVAEYITSLEERIADMSQILQNLQRMYFGRKSEKIRIPVMENGSEQLSIFSNESPVSEEKPAEPETVEVSGHKRRKKRSQEEIIAELPVIVHEHIIPEAERRCPRCGNTQLEYIGKELVYTEYERVPAHIDKHEHYVAKYACHACEDGTDACKTCEKAGTEACRNCPDRPAMVIVAAKLPEEYQHTLINGSKASASIVSQICYDKFELALPEYRQEKEWERLGFPLSRQTMSNWILKVDSDYLRTITGYMQKTITRESHVIHCDETWVKVLDEKTGNGNPKKCHMWVVRSGKYEPKQLVVYNYRASRSGDIPTDILPGYKEYFVSDGYAGYNELSREAKRCGCWAHVRRKFYDSIPNHNMELKSLGRTGCTYCDRLFRIEEKLERVSADERVRIRRAESLPIIEEFYAWAENCQPTHDNQREVLKYAQNQKDALMRFLEDGYIPISNNAAENAIRPFVVGRKNWLFCKSNDGAIAAADVCSLVETAKANKLDVLKYLNFLFLHVSKPRFELTDENVETLMPWNAAVQESCKRGYI